MKRVTHKFVLFSNVCVVPIDGPRCHSVLGWDHGEVDSNFEHQCAVQLSTLQPSWAHVVEQVFLD